MIDTINQINREVAAELGINEDIVKRINSFHWNEVKNAIRSLDHTAIRVRGFGTFMISRAKLHGNIKKLIHEIRYLKNSEKEFKKKTKEEYLEEKYLKLRSYLDRRNDLAILFYEKVRDRKIRKSKQNDK